MNLLFSGKKIEKYIVLKNIFFFICLLICSCNYSSINPDLEGLRLVGRTNKVEDGTTIFVTDILSNQVLDSIIIYNNAFEFKRKLSASPQHLFLHTKDYSETKTLWAENEEMFFDAAHSNFEDGVIIGKYVWGEKLIQLIEQEFQDQ